MGLLVRSALGAATALGLLAISTACSPASPAPTTPATSPATSPASPTAAVSATSTTPADPTAGWSPYHDATARLSLRYPPAWQQRTCTGGEFTSLYLGPTAADVAACNSDFTGQISAIVFSGDQRSSLHLTGSGLTSTAVTVDGVGGSREQATAAPSEAEIGPAAGSVLVVYAFYTAGQTYRFGYVQAPSGATSTNVLSDFDLMVTRTVQFS
jgi:hypothetical protein